MAELLLVEDDDTVAAPLQAVLTREGHVVTRVPTGEQGVQAALGGSYDLVLLDLGLPDMDGNEVCRRIREGGSDIAIFMVTARDEELDRVVGLDVGADDYLAKPFGLAELTARVRALLRRRGVSAAPPAAAAPAPTAVDGFSVDEASRRVTVDGGDLPLTVKEFDVLALLARHPDAVVKRERLIEEVWDANWFGSTKVLDVTVARLRAKLEERGAPVRVATVRGVGFRLEAVASEGAVRESASGSAS